MTGQAGGAVATQEAAPAVAPSKDASLDVLEHEVGILVRRIRRVLADRARAVHPDLSTPAFLLLSHLAEEGPIRSSVVVETFGIDKGAISRQVTQLCELGLIRRTPDPLDGRAQLIEVTEDGIARIAAMTEHRRALLAKRLDGWADADLADFVSLLGRYNRSLDRLVESP